MELLTITVYNLLYITLQEVKEDQKLSEKLRSIHLLTARKHKIDATRQIRQARLLAAKSFNCSLPVHIPHKKQHKITPGYVKKVINSDGQQFHQYQQNQQSSLS
jgi:hypothetical protein